MYNDRTHVGFIIGSTAILAFGVTAYFRTSNLIPGILFFNSVWCRCTLFWWVLYMFTTEAAATATHWKTKRWKRTSYVTSPWKHNTKKNNDRYKECMHVCGGRAGLHMDT
jgi:hypothetical protein